MYVYIYRVVKKKVSFRIFSIIKTTVATRFNGFEGTWSFWLLNPSTFKLNSYNLSLWFYIIHIFFLLFEIDPWGINEVLIIKCCSLSCPVFLFCFSPFHCPYYLSYFISLSLSHSHIFFLSLPRFSVISIHLFFHCLFYWLSGNPNFFVFYFLLRIWNHYAPIWWDLCFFTPFMSIERITMCKEIWAPEI